jgi:hypothetical protein
MTRSFELPFPPYEGLAVFSSSWEFYPEPQGLRLKDIVWDVDRRLFLACSRMVHGGLPIAGIAAELSDWVGRGWRLGSYNDHYTGGGEIELPGPMAKEACDLHDTVDDKEYEILHTLPPKRRPAAFNAFWKAMIRHMAATHNNADVAYAMDKTGRYFGPSREKVKDEKGEEAWGESSLEYRKMTIDDRIKWMRKTEKYPELSTLIHVPEQARPPVAAEA